MLKSSLRLSVDLFGPPNHHLGSQSSNNPNKGFQTQTLGVWCSVQLGRASPHGNSCSNHCWGTKREKKDYQQLLLNASKQKGGYISIYHIQLNNHLLSRLLLEQHLWYFVRAKLRGAAGVWALVWSGAAVFCLFKRRKKQLFFIELLDYQSIMFISSETIRTGQRLFAYLSCCVESGWTCFW